MKIYRHDCWRKMYTERCFSFFSNCTNWSAINCCLMSTFLKLLDSWKFYLHIIFLKLLHFHRKAQNTIRFFNNWVKASVNFILFSNKNNIKSSRWMTNFSYRTVQKSENIYFELESKFWANKDSSIYAIFIKKKFYV